MTLHELPWCLGSTSRLKCSPLRAIAVAIGAVLIVPSALLGLFKWEVLFWFGFYETYQQRCGVLAWMGRDG